MIIWGWRGVTSTKGQDQFHCPTCNSKMAYKHKLVRRFFTLYFIPVIPLNKQGEYIECQQCRGTYQMAVLDFDPEKAAQKFEAEFHKAIKRTMVDMMLADGVVDDEEVRTIQGTYRELTGVELSAADVQQEIRTATEENIPVQQFLGTMAGNLNDAGKEMVITAAFRVAAADGEFQDEEKAYLGEIGTALDMSPAHVSGVLQTISAQTA